MMVVESEITAADETMSQQQKPLQPKTKMLFRNELTDVLRKRGLRPETSEEDLGLPQSPVTPNRKEKVMHHSQGSLSILSITSSDMDEEHSSMKQSATFDSSTSSSFFNKTSSDFSHASDEVDLDLSSSSRLSHSAAKHKLAVKPKKKGPSRPRRSREPTTILPSTPEVNEETIKSSASAADITDNTPTKKLKSQSLPRETDPKSIHMFSINGKDGLTASTTMHEITKTPQKTTIYVNKNISKSHDFDKTTTSSSGQASTTTTVSVNSSGATVTQIKKPDDGLMKKFWNRNAPKKTKDEAGLEAEEDSTRDVLEHKSILQINSDTDSKENLLKKSRTGAAARQRVVPMDIDDPKPVKPDVPEIKEKPTGISPLKVTKPIPIARTSISSSARISVHKSNEDLLSRSLEKPDTITSRSTSPPKTSWQEQLNLKAPKAVERTVVSPVRSKDETQLLTPKRTVTVEKSKSFRSYTDTSSINEQKSSNLPSLPNLSNTESKLASKLPFTSLTERYAELKRTDTDEIEQKPGQKFEINDYNLVKGRHEESSMIKKRNLVLKGVEELPATVQTSANISQIEENIDKLMKSGVTTMLKSASIDRDDDEIQMEIIDSPSESTSSSKSASPKHVSSQKIPSSPSSPKTPSSPTVIFSEKKQDPEETEVVLREKRVSSVLERFEAKSAEAVKFKKPLPKTEESKPPKPPTALRISTGRGSVEKSEPPSSPTKSSSDETEIKPPVIGDNDDRKVILQRRTSVSEERLKFERRISGGDEFKSERKKSQSEESVDKQQHQSLKDSKRSTQTSDEETEPSFVQLRKKSITDQGRKDDTPELMKVFARRSLKIHADDEDKIREEIAKMQKIGNIDSDKENQSSSEEKLDKLAPSVLHTAISNSANNNKNNNNSSNGTTNGSNGQKSGSNTTATIKDKDDNVIESDQTPRKSTTIIAPKPFGTPNRYSNVVNYRSTQPFSEIRKNLQSKGVTTAQTTNNNNANNQDKIKSTTSLNSGTDKISGNGLSNNNHAGTGVNNRHTLATSVPNIITSDKKIGGDDEGEMEFKGILQRKAEWEKRAKEGFK